MNEKLIKPYEISVWEDKLVPIQNTDPVEYRTEESKLAIIGSNTMTGLNKIYNPVFNKKSNGERSLSFSLKYKYFDPYTGNDEVINPFAALLVNERKIKLHYDDEWYEFIIKEHTESTEDNEWTYTCMDAFVLELSKTGYNITFDVELNNNQGTAEELTKETIKDTNWRIGNINAGKQYVAEPIYKAILHNVNAINILNVDRNQTATFEENTDIYVFYSYITNKNGSFVQFIVHDEEKQYTIDSKNVITDTNFRIKEKLDYKESNNIKGFYYNNSLIIELQEVEVRYQANRLAYNQKTTYDPIMQRTVDIFRVGDREIYKYVDNIYSTSDVIMNYITNGDNFNVLEEGDLQGWNPYVMGPEKGTDAYGETIKKLELVTKPELSTDVTLATLSQLSNVEGFLKVQFNGAKTNDYKNLIYNSGFENNVSFIESVSQGQEYVFRWRAKKGDINSTVPADNLRLIVAKYTADTSTPYHYYFKHIDPQNIILEFTGIPVILNNIIEGGYIENNSYYIDGVAQTVSTKYIYKDSRQNDQEYVWVNGEFVLKNSTNYLPYYYLRATAQKTVSNSTLTDPTKRYGIFLYNTEGAGNYFIQEVQLTRFIPDIDDKPILIGNVPTAENKLNEYYYLKPSNGIVKEDIKTYATVDALKNDLGITSEVNPVYNENSEKVLSISASQSSCFDILQTIAETFECWVELDVKHDESGYILYDEYDKLQKYINIREYIGKDNHAGFKYGVNLQSIERTINSDEIVTKLIVDQSQSEYTDEGFISITEAPSNISKESYILNFDYYYKQGLLNREEVEADRLDFVEKISNINNQLKKAEKKRVNYSNSYIKLNSDRNTYTELVITAQDNKTNALADFFDLTSYTYDDYQTKQENSVKHSDGYYFKTSDTTVNTNKGYYNSNFELVTPGQSDNPKSKGWYEKLLDIMEEDNLIELLGEIYINSAYINNYTGLLTNINKEYEEIKTKLYGYDNYNIKIWVGRDALNDRHVYLELNDYLVGFRIQLGGQEEEVTVSKKFFDIKSGSRQVTLIAPNNYTIDGASQKIYTIDDETTVYFKIISSRTQEGISDIVDGLIEEKAQLIKDFNNKYARFIQEGTWNSTEYVDSELYYLDALQVSNTSAQPTVSYTIDVVEISQLEGFEWYLFDTGDKTYIEDTEFFGWSNINIGTENEPNYILTPAREEVIVSEVEWHLEEPDQNTITVQNYKTRFEDLFQRISATVQTVQYNEATYAKISTLLDANGTINQNVLSESLNNLSGKQYALTSNGSIIVQDDNILVQNLTNPANRVMINSEGIRISSDGGNTWSTAIDGQGINIGLVYTGSLNTNEVIIGNKNNPSFRWDKVGISAYRVKNDANNEYVLTIDEIVVPNKTYYELEDGIYTEVQNPSGNPAENEYYELIIGDLTDLKSFVRFDQYGIYGIKNNATFKAQNLDDVKNNAHFAVTWDGFFIKNSYADGGRVSITSDNDFQVTKNVNNAEQEVIKIGMLEERVGGNLYGMRIKGENNTNAFIADSDGNLSVTGIINATGGNFSDLVAVGTGNPYIKIDGANALIGTSNYQEGAGSGWMINAAGDAVFNNITARGAIKTAVFEYAEIQAVGGVFIFRPSSTIRSATIDEDDLVLSVEKPILFKEGQWCKVSNYIGKNQEPIDTQPILLNNGLTHVYEVGNKETIGGITYITLLGAAAMVEGQEAVVESASDLIGGALVDMGNKAGTSNYGIGINSSDNTVNLPARAISLFETVIDETQEPKVTYNYRGILGILPAISSNKISPIYTAYMEGKQGIYTDNMYIGDKNQYIAFYKDNNGDSQLRLVAKSFEILPDDSDLPIDLGDSIVDQKVQYTLSTSMSENTVEEDWNEIPYEVTTGYYQWQRTYIKYAKGRIDYLPSEDGYYMSSEAGQPGPPGPAGQPGEDAVVLTIDSSNGNTFKNNSVNTILSVIIYKGTIVINNLVHLKEIFGNTAYLQWYWKRLGENDFHPISIDDSMLSNGGFNLTLTPDKVDVKVVFQCEIKTTEN